MTDTSTDPSTAQVAREAAQDTARTAADQGRQVAGTAAEQAKEVASVASDQVATVGGQALDQARTVLDSASGDVREQLEQRLRTLSDQARTTAEELQALVEGRPEDAGRTKDLAKSASERIERMADKVDDLGIQGVVEEVTDLARRRPVLFLAGAATAGILVGRMARAGKEAQSGSGGSGGSVGSGGSSEQAVGADGTTPGWGETANGAPVTATALIPPTTPTFDPAPLPPVGG